MNLIVAPSFRCKFTLLFRWIGPDKYSPAGTTTFPPPALLQAAIASRKASVQSEDLVETPNFVMSNVRSAKIGALIRARISGTRAHGSASDINVLNPRRG